MFLAGALAIFGLAEMRSGVDVRGNVGWLGYWLARPLVMLVGWPAAVLTPAIPAVHAIRLFGRLESETDRSWMIFFAGVVAILPIAVALAVGAPPAGEVSGAAGLWGGFVAFYWRQFLGGFGAWVVVALAISVLTAVTLRWNPVRVLVGRKAAPPVPSTDDPTVESYTPPKSRRKKKGQPDNLALSLEPSPEEFASIDSVAALQAASSADADAKEDAAIEEASKRRGKKKDGSAHKPGRDEQIAAAIDATEKPESSADELPPSDLLTYPAGTQSRSRSPRARRDGPQAHGRPSHLQGRRRARWPHDGAGRHAVRDRAGTRREGATVREPVERSRARDARRVDSHRRAHSRAAARSASRCRIRTPRSSAFAS